MPEWFPRRSSLAPDALAGLTTAVIGAPQAMGFALLAGIAPIYGLYTAAIAPIIGGLLSSSTYMSIGPTNALALVVYSTLNTPGSERPIEALFTLTLLVGAFQAAFGLLRLGDLTRFVSNAVMTGFITGAGLLIILGQLGNFTGYSPEGSSSLPRAADWLAHIGDWDVRTTAVGLLALGFIIATRPTRLRRLGPLLAIVLGSLIAVVLDWEVVRQVRDIAPVPPGLPGAALPDLAFAAELLPAALSIAVLALVQSAGITQSVPEPDGSTAEPNRDFLAQGAANLIGSLFQNMPSGGSLSRTAVNVSAGARTRLANILAGVYVVIILLTLGPFIERVALTALAALLFVAAASLIKTDEIRMVWRVSPSGRTAMFATFVATLILPLEFSIYVGVALSLGLYVYTSSLNLDLVALEQDEHGRFREESLPRRLPNCKPVIVSVNGHLYFAAVRQLEKRLPDPETTSHPLVILRLRHNQYLGTTGIRILSRYADLLEARGGKLMFCGVELALREQLERTGAVRRFGAENIFYARSTLLSSTEAALKAARKWLSDRCN